MVTIIGKAEASIFKYFENVGEDQLKNRDAHCVSELLGGVRITCSLNKRVRNTLQQSHIFQRDTTGKHATSPVKPPEQT